jgi:hypothetical protein
MPYEHEWQNDPAARRGWNDAHEIMNLHKFRDELSITVLANVFANARMRSASLEDRAKYVEYFCDHFRIRYQLETKQKVPRRISVAAHDRVRLMRVINSK